MPLTADKKKEIIDRLITNEGVLCDNCNVWDEDDRAALNAIPEDKLLAMDRQRELLANVSIDPDDVDDDDDSGDTDDAVQNQQKPAKAPVTNQRPKPKTADEWLADAPPEIKSAVNNALSFERGQKNALIERIVKNERNAFSKKYLAERSLEELQGLAALATNGQEDPRQHQPNVLLPNYAGVPGFVHNLSEDFAREDMDMIPEPFDWSQN